MEPTIEVHGRAWVWLCSVGVCQWGGWGVKTAPLNWLIICQVGSWVLDTDNPVIGSRAHRAGRLPLWLHELRRLLASLICTKSSSFQKPHVGFVLVHVRAWTDGIWGKFKSGLRPFVRPWFDLWPPGVHRGNALGRLGCYKVQALENHFGRS